MFKFLEQTFGKREADIFASLPANPLSDELTAIELDVILDDGECAFLKVPATWHRFKSTIRSKGVSARVAPGFYLRGSEAQIAAPQLTLISQGTLILTSRKLRFVGTAKSMVIGWQDYSSSIVGLDHLKIFRSAGDTEIFIIEESQLAPRQEAFRDLVCRLQSDWIISQTVVVGSDTNSDDAGTVNEPCRQSDSGSLVFDEIEEARKAIENSITEQQLEKEFRSAIGRIETFQDELTPEIIENSHRIAQLTASLRLNELIQEGACDNRASVERLWQLFGNTEDPPRRSVVNVIAENFDSLRYDIDDSETSEALIEAYERARNFLASNEQSLTGRLFELMGEQIQLEASHRLIHLVVVGACELSEGLGIWHALGNDCAETYWEGVDSGLNAGN